MPPSCRPALLQPSGGIGITLANHGVLFLDELAEFIAPVLDGLRQPLEDGVVESVTAGRRPRGQDSGLFAGGTG
jgi:transcriptional regulator with AAA-type ATPase domain